MSELAHKCILFRARNRLNQASFAEMCGVSRITISHIESGKKVSKITETKVRMAIGELK